MNRDEDELLSHHYRVEEQLHPAMVQPYCRTLHATPSWIYERSYPCRHSFRMRQRYRHVDDDRRHPYFQTMMEVLIHLDHLMKEHLLRPDGMAIHLDVLLLVHHQDVLQNLDELHQGANLSYQDVLLPVPDAHLGAMVVVLVDVALVDVGSHQRQLRTDYFRREADVADCLQLVLGLQHLVL